jgi:hypothetical protein
MTTIDITDVRPIGNSFAEGRLNPPDEVWAPPLAPNETTAPGQVFLHEETFRPLIEGEDTYQPLEPSNLYETFGSRRKLIAATAIIAALGVAGLTYFFLASPGAKVPAETTESSPIAVQSSSETLVQPAPTVPEPTVEASRLVAPSAVTPQSPESASAPQAQDLVFLQRPGVNIRSAPSGNAPVLGTAPKGMRFTARSREGDWVQVESAGLKGWINSQFLAPNKPQ